MEGTAPPNPTGRAGEDLAAEFYERDGWVVVDRNWRTRFGELDLVCVREREVAFVEVKTRRDAGRFGGAAAVVDPRKLLRVRRTAERWLAVHPGAGALSPRIDVVAIDLDRRGEVTDLTRFECCE